VHGETAFDDVDTQTRLTPLMRL